MSSTKSTYEDLLTFVKYEMETSANYQPLIIRALLKSGGKMTALDLSKELMLGNDLEVGKYRSILMRYPKKTLMKRGIIQYDRKSKVFELLARSGEERMIEQIVECCDRELAKWRLAVQRTESSSLRYDLIDEAGGRCQACGALAHNSPLHIDHIVPKDLAKRGRVATADGQRIDVESRENLQVLCETCNCGKRASSRTDFRPSEERLLESLIATLGHAADLGYDVNSMTATAQGRFRSRDHLTAADGHSRVRTRAPTKKRTSGRESR